MRIEKSKKNAYTQGSKIYRRKNNMAKVALMGIMFLIASAMTAYGAPDWSMPTATCDGNGEYIWGYEWYQILGQLPATVQTHFVADHCFSGGIVRDLGGLQNHAGFAASNEHELSWGGKPDGGDFMNPFLNELDQDKGTFNSSFEEADPPKSTKMADPAAGSNDEIDYSPEAGEVWKAIVWITNEEGPGFIEDGEHAMDVLKGHGWTDDNIELMFGNAAGTVLDDQGTSSSSDDVKSDRAQTQSELVNYVSALMNVQNLTRLDIFLSCHGTFTDRVVTEVGNDGKDFNYQVTWGDYREKAYGPEYYYVELGDQDPTHWEGDSVTIGGDTWLYAEVQKDGRWYARWGNTGTNYNYRDIVFPLHYTEPDPLPYLANWATYTTNVGKPGTVILADSSEGKTVYKNNTGIGDPVNPPVTDSYLHALGDGLGTPTDGLFDYPVAKTTWGGGTGYDWYYGAVSAKPIPEPTTIFLLGFGLIGLLGIIDRQQRRKR